MTLCNVVVTAERVMMVTDTLVGYDHRPVGFSTKCTLLAHCTALLAARGPDDFRHETVLFLDHSYLPAGVETAAEILPPFLVDLEDSLAHKYVGDRDLIGEVLVAGWSPTRRRFAGWYFGHGDGHGDGYDAHELALDHTHYLPAGPDYRPIPKVDFGDRLIELAKKQHEVMVGETPPGRCVTVGGDLIVHDMTKAGVTVRKVARLDGYDALVAQIRGEAEAA